MAIGIVLSVSATKNDKDINEQLDDENPLDVLYEAVD
jgi:hypothetical protein